MKKSSLIFITFMILLGGCSKNNSPISNSTSSSTPISVDYRESALENVDPVVNEELKACFDFFYETAVTEENSPAYGLIPDRYNVKTNKRGAFASIASIGFGLATLPIGVEYGWITEEEGYDRAYKTIANLEKLERVNGFYYHFLKMTNGERWQRVELSVIDTAILVCGALTAGKYFGGDCETIANRIYESVNWKWYYNESTMMFYMGYSPENQILYGNGFSGAWDHYAEQLMLYVLAAGAPNEKYKVNSDAYLVMKSVAMNDICAKTDKYDPFITTWTGSIFTYQFSHSFIDFRNIVDEDGFDWYANSVNASKAHIAFAEAQSDKYLTYSDSAWGFTACDGPNGYSGAYGAKPCKRQSIGEEPLVDGTVPPCGAIGSIAFTPEDSIRAMKHFKENDKLWSKYGFIDAYNLGTKGNHKDVTIEGKIPEGGWYASDVIGIDKGVSALMIENYVSNMIWNIFMDVDYVQNGLKELGFTSR